MTIKKTIIVLATILILAFSFNNVSAAEGDIAQLVAYLNESGGIPLRMITQTSTNWSQYLTSLALSSIMIIWLFGQMIGETMGSIGAKIFFKAIKSKTKRNIMFIKHTQQALFGGSMIDQKTLYKIQEGLNKFGGKDFDLILHTPGGEIFAAQYISRLFKNYPGKITAVVPSFAMSGGSLLALSSDRIIMAPSATLGPIDPQLGSLFKFGSAKAWDKIVKFKGKKADDSSISMQMMGQQYTNSIRDGLMEVIDFGLDHDKKKKFVNFLTDGNVEHAYQLTPEKLKSFGIPVILMKNNKLLMKLIKFISRAGSEGVTFV